MTHTKARLLSAAIAVAVLGLAAAPVAALDASKVPGGKKTKLGLYVTPKEAYELMQKNKGKALFVDVRTPGEVEFLGTAGVTNAHVPYELIDTSKWDAKKNRYHQYVNKNFVADITARVQKMGLSKDTPIVLMCRSGSRSAHGANALAAAGYTKVYNQVEGFEGDKAKTGPNKGQRAVNGWKNANLPWSYRMSKDLMYVTK